jgi:bla regulator protein blaR1
MKCCVTLILASAACLLNASRTRAQSRPERPEFEVASIKPGNPDSRLLRTVITPGGNLRAENVTLRTLIQDAYRMRPFQLSGGPRWIDEDKFQVIAKGDESATPDQVWRMLQALLEDRFRLALRRETREQTISYLTVKNEPKLSPSKEGTGSGFATAVHPDGVNHVAFRATSMAALADMLSRQMGHVVEDRTGLSGAFDFELDATHDENEPNPFVAPWAPSLGQIGLKLESAKGRVEFFTIERAEKPSEN